MTSLGDLFGALDTWTPADSYDDAALAAAGIHGDVAALLAEVGSGVIDTSERVGGDRHHVLDPEGVAYWSREVLEKLQGICQPAGLQTFFIDDGGGTYAFACSNGVYTFHYQRGLLARFDDVAAFFRDAMAGEVVFGTRGDPDALAERLRQAEQIVETPLAERLAGKTHQEFRRYDPYVPWRDGELMTHPAHGRGIVTAVKSTMFIQVEFAGGRVTLAHKGW